EHQVGPLRHLCHVGFGVGGGYLLGFVDNKKEIRNGACADGAGGLGCHEIRVQDRIVGHVSNGGGKRIVAGFAGSGRLFALGGACLFGGEDEFEGVVDRLEPRVELLFE